MYLTIKDITHNKGEGSTVIYHVQRQSCIDYGGAGRKRGKPISTPLNIKERVYKLSGTMV